MVTALTSTVDGDDAPSTVDSGVASRKPPQCTSQPLHDKLLFTATMVRG
ncbi:hypothetical protein glysoja_021390 [Glycine soja]|nr:hypothetical protein glysoja_021390 [Glycine soja]